MKEARCEVAEDKQIPFASNRCNASLFLSSTDKRRLAALAVSFIIAVSCIPVLLSSIPRIYPHDLVFHLYRIDGIAQGLREGQFPVRMQSTQVFGLGYPVSVFYGDLFLYFPALLRLLGMSVRASYALFIVAVNTFCASVTYVTCKRMFRSYSVALLGCALWTLSPYRLLIDMWLRAAVGEYLALCFFPVIAYGLFSIFNQGALGASKKGWLWCALGACGVVYSHVLSVLLCFVLFLPVAILLLIHRHNKDVIVQIIKFVAVTLLLSLAFIVPFLDYYDSFAMRATAIADNSAFERMSKYALEPAELFLFLAPVYGAGGFSLGDSMPLEIGWSVLLAASSWIVIMALPAVHGRIPRPTRFLGTFLIVLAVILCWMSTVYFPWSGNVPSALLPVMGILAKIQFPWRLLGEITFILVFSGCLSLTLLGVFSIKLRNVCCVVLVGLSAIEALFGLTTFMTHAEELPTDYIEVDNTGVMGAEYLPDGFDLERVETRLDNLPEVTGDISIESYDKNGINITFYGFSQNGSGGGTVELPLIAYPHYAVTSDGNECSLGVSDDGLLLVTVPDGFNGEVSIHFAEPLSWRISFLISITALLIITAFQVRSYFQVHGVRKNHGSRSSVVGKDC